MPVNMGTASGSLNLSAKGFVDGINTAITALEKLKTKANDAKEDVKEFGDEAVNTKSKTGSLGDKVKESGEKVKGYDDKVKTAKQNTKGFGDESDKAKEKVKTLGDSLKTVGDKLTGYGDKISKAGTGMSKYITAPAALIGGFSIKKFSDFESAMSTVQATSGSTAEDMVKLSNKAKQMGESTKFSATESAEALNYMAMAGWKTEEMLSGIEGIMDLAAASGEDLANTSDIVTDALTGFGLTAQDSARFADVLAAASSNANTNVSMMGESFKYVAPVAGALGYSAEDVAINLGLMANSGIKGGQAGTALRAALSRLIKPTDDVSEMMKKLNISMIDSNGKVKSLRELNTDLRTSFSKLSDAEQTQAATILFGQEAMSGMLAVIRSGETDYNKLANAIDNSQGVAKKMSEIRMDNFSGQLTLLKSKAEGVGIQFGQQIIPYLSKFVDKLSDILNWFGKLDDGTKNLIVRSAGLLAALGPVLKIIGNVTKAAGGLSKAFGLIANHPIVAATALIAGGIAAITTAMTNNIDVVPKEYNAYKEFSDEVRKTAEEFDKLKEARKKSVEATDAEFGKYEALKTELDKITDANGRVKTGYLDRAKFITGELSRATGIEIEYNGNIIKSYQNISAEIDKVILKKRAEAYMDAYKESYTTALTKQAQAQKQLLTAEQNRTEASLKYNEVQKELIANQNEYNNLITVRDPSRDQTKRMTELSDAISKGKSNLEKLSNELSNANSDWRAAQITYTGYVSTIKNYEAANAAIISGNEKKIKEATNNLVNDFVTATDGAKYQLQKQYDDAKEHYEQLKIAVKDGTSAVTQEQVKAAEELTKKAKEELDKREIIEVELTRKKKAQLTQQYNDANKYYEDLKKLVGRQGYGVTQQMVDEAKKARDGIKQQLDGIKDDGKQFGEDFVNGFSSGISVLLPGLGSQISNMAKMALSSLATGLDSHSPSRKAAKYGLWFVQGFANAISENKALVQEAITGMTDVALATLSVSPDNYSIDRQSFNLGQPGATGVTNTSNQTNTFNFYSPEPIDEIRAANELKKVQKQLAEGFI